MIKIRLPHYLLWSALAHLRFHYKTEGRQEHSDAGHWAAEGPGNTSCIPRPDQHCSIFLESINEGPCDWGLPTLSWEDRQLTLPFIPKISSLHWNSSNSWSSIPRAQYIPLPFLQEKRNTQGDEEPKFYMSEELWTAYLQKSLLKSEINRGWVTKRSLKWKEGGWGSNTALMPAKQDKNLPTPCSQSPLTPLPLNYFCKQKGSQLGCVQNETHVHLTFCP